MNSKKSDGVEEGEEVGGGSAEGPSATGDAAGASLMSDVDGPHVCTFESPQLEGLYVGDFLYN